MLAKILILSFFAIIAQSQNPCRTISEGQYFASNPRGCSWYFYCEDPNNPAEGKCPDNLHFNIVGQTCSYPDSIIPRCFIDEDLLSNTEFECPNNYDMRKIPHPFDCGKFTLCWQNEWSDFSCPSEEPHFSIFDNNCRSEFLADCRAEQRFCGSGELETFLANPRTCDDYLLCTRCQNEFTLLHWWCPEGYKFNNQRGICEVKENFQCHVTEYPDFVPPAEPFSIDCDDAPPNAPIFRPHPNDCSLYFLCLSRTSPSILEKCPEGTKFSTANNRCAPEATAVCYDGSSKSVTKISPKVTNVIPRIDI